MSRQVPQQVTPTQGQRRGKAPYNFVPLPEQVLTIEGDPFSQHDVLLPDCLHGEIALRIVCETETYTRCAYPPEEETRKVSESAPRQEFYHHEDDAVPVIPGSTQRGMVRSLVEVIASARITRRPEQGKAIRVRDERLVFRQVADQRTPSGKEYDRRFIGKRGGRDLDYPHLDVKAGYLESDDRGNWRVRPAQILPAGGRAFTSVTEGVLVGRGFTVPPKDGKGDDGISNKVLDIWFQPVPIVAHASRNVVLWHSRTGVVSSTAAAGLVPGRLVYTGPMRTRHMHTIVHPPDPNSTAVPIPSDVWDQYQEDRDMHRGIKSRPIRSKGDVLFYVEDGSGRVAFLGPCPFFRVPYKKYTADFVPMHTMGGDDGALDMAEAIFGTVNGEAIDGKPHTGAHRGRVKFDDAVLASPPPEGTFLDGNQGRRWPAVLSAPKPTSYQIYLVQTAADGQKENLHSYSADPGDTLLRGFKRYWHRGSPGPVELSSTAPESHDSQYTKIRPVRPRVAFQGRIRFENLRPEELGALLAAIELPSSCRHHLGMGKPLGMGTVRVEPTVRLYDPKDRYRSLDADGFYPEDTSAAKLVNAREAFRLRVVQHHNRSVTSPRLPESTATLWDVPRLGALRRLLEWDARPPRQATAYMTDLAQFRDRQVLPRPEDVATVPGLPRIEPVVTPLPDDRASSKAPAHREPSARGPRNVSRPESRPTPTLPVVTDTRAGRIVQFSWSGVRIRVEGEPKDRTVPVDVRMFPHESWGRPDGKTIQAGRVVQIDFADGKILQILPRSPN